MWVIERYVCSLWSRNTSCYLDNEPTSGSTETYIHTHTGKAGAIGHTWNTWLVQTITDRKWRKKTHKEQRLQNKTGNRTQGHRNNSDKHKHKEVKKHEVIIKQKTLLIKKRTKETHRIQNPYTITPTDLLFSLQVDNLEFPTHGLGKLTMDKSPKEKSCVCVIKYVLPLQTHFIWGKMALLIVKVAYKGSLVSYNLWYLFQASPLIRSETFMFGIWFGIKGPRVHKAWQSYILAGEQWVRSQPQ